MKNSKQLSKAEKMLYAIHKLLHQAEKFTILAMLEVNSKKRDKFIVKIMDYNEQIEKEYSTNWH